MKSLLVVLLTANVMVGAWLFLGGPLDVTREPGRMDLQIQADQFRLLSDADVDRMRSAAERGAAPSTPAAATPRLDAYAVPTPSPACVEIGDFASENAARKARARLAAIGLSERTSLTGAGRATRLRVTGVDAATELRIDNILKDYPKQRLERCTETAGGR